MEELRFTPPPVEEMQDPLRYSTMVCVTDQLRCDRIIKSGKAVADMTDTDLVVINICTPGKESDPVAMEYLFRVSAEYSGKMTLLYSSDVSKSIVKYIKDNKVACMVTGVPSNNNNIITKIWRKFTHVNFFIVDYNGDITEVTRSMIAQYETSSNS